MPLSIIFVRLCQLGKVPDDWRHKNATPMFMKGKNEDVGNYRLVSLISSPGKVVEQLILGTISRHVKDKKVIRNSHHGMMKEKSHLTNLTVCYKELASLVDERRAVDYVYCNFSKAFDFVSDNNLTKYGLEKWTKKRVEKWLNRWTQKVVISSTKSSGRQVTCTSQGLILGSVLFSILIYDVHDRTEDKIGRNY